MGYIAASIAFLGICIYLGLSNIAAVLSEYVDYLIVKDQYEPTEEGTDQR